MTFSEKELLAQAHGRIRELEDQVAQLETANDDLQSELDAAKDENRVLVGSVTELEDRLSKFEDAIDNIERIADRLL